MESYIPSLIYIIILEVSSLLWIDFQWTVERWTEDVATASTSWDKYFSLHI